MIVNVSLEGLDKVLKTIGSGLGTVMPFLPKRLAAGEIEANILRSEADRENLIEDAKTAASVKEILAIGDARAALRAVQGEEAVRQLKQSFEEQATNIRAQLKAAEEIDIPVFEGEPIERVSEIPDLVTRADRRGHIEAVRRQANLELIAIEAGKAILDQENVSDEPVSPEFVARFFSSAQDVSTEELQAIWGRILAGEVTKPGSIPLRTLDVLRNLTKEEAKAVANLAACTSRNGMYVIAGGGLSSSVLSSLQDAGVLEEHSKQLKWQPIAQGDKLVAAVSRFGDKFKLRLNATRDEDPQGLGFTFASGHVLNVQVATRMYKLFVLLVRQSAEPILNLVTQPASVNVNYLASVVDDLNGQPYFQAWVEEPPDWEGEKLPIELTHPPGPSAALAGPSWATVPRRSEIRYPISSRSPTDVTESLAHDDTDDQVPDDGHHFMMG